MADIQFICPGCQQVLEAPAEAGGSTVQCPACGVDLRIPGSNEPAAAQAGATARGTAAAGSTARRVACQACGAEMAEDCVLCLHCGFHRTLGRRLSTEFT